MIIIVSIISIVFLNSNGETNEIPLERIVSWEMVVLIVYLLWLISINLKHFKRINMRKVPSQYYLYSTLSTLVIFGQTIFFLVNYLISLVDLADANFNEQLKRFNFIHYLFMFLNFLLILIQQIILDNFSVDII
jgi:hypothetical protein